MAVRALWCEQVISPGLGQFSQLYLILDMAGLDLVLVCHHPASVHFLLVLCSHLSYYDHRLFTIDLALTSLFIFHTVCNLSHGGVKKFSVP